MIKFIRKSAIFTTIMLGLPGCIIMSDIAEGFSCVPYDGMYTTAYSSTKDEEGNFHYWKEQFPIGFWGDLNVKFWNAFGDYHNTRTWKRYQEWRALPEEQRRVEIPEKEWPYGGKRR